MSYYFFYSYSLCEWWSDGLFCDILSKIDGGGIFRADVWRSVLQTAPFVFWKKENGHFMDHLRGKTLAALILSGVTAGLTGFLLTVALHYIQAWFYSGGIYGDISFREMVESVTPAHRLGVLLICGAAAGIGWFLIYRWGSPLVSVKNAVLHPERGIPL